MRFSLKIYSFYFLGFLGGICAVFSAKKKQRKIHKTSLQWSISYLKSTNRLLLFLQFRKCKNFSRIDKKSLLKLSAKFASWAFCRAACLLSCFLVFELCCSSEGEWGEGQLGRREGEKEGKLACKTSIKIQKKRKKPKITLLFARFYWKTRPKRVRFLIFWIGRSRAGKGIFGSFFSKLGPGHIQLLISDTFRTPLSTECTIFFLGSHN